jgi:hypothetical protein
MIYKILGLLLITPFLAAAWTFDDYFKDINPWPGGDSI